MIAPILFLALAGTATAQNACDMMGGLSLSFDYSTTEDPDIWFSNYKGYGKFQAVNYRRRTTFYNAEGRRRAVVQQQQRRMPYMPQQQQIQSNDFFSSNANIPPSPMGATTEPTPTSSTTPKPPPLPIWKLKMPRHLSSLTARKLEEAQIDYTSEEDGSLSDAFAFQGDELTTANNNTEYKGYQKILDVTDAEIETDARYLICGKLSVSLNGEAAECERCTLIRACTASYNCDEDLVRGMTELTRFTSQTQTTIQYQLGELPGSDHVITSSLYFEPQTRRCARDLYAEPMDTISTPVQANSVALVTVPGLRKRKGFRVEARLRMKLGGEEVEMSVSSPESLGYCSGKAINSNLDNIPEDNEYS